MIFTIGIAIALLVGYVLIVMEDKYNDGYR
jgi:hypothetical protein